MAPNTPKMHKSSPIVPKECMCYYGSSQETLLKPHPGASTCLSGLVRELWMQSGSSRARACASSTLRTKSMNPFSLRVFPRIDWMFLYVTSHELGCQTTPPQTQTTCPHKIRAPRVPTLTTGSENVTVPAWVSNHGIAMQRGNEIVSIQPCKTHLKNQPRQPAKTSQTRRDNTINTLYQIALFQAPRPTQWAVQHKTSQRMQTIQHSRDTNHCKHHESGTHDLITPSPAQCRS